MHANLCSGGNRRSEEPLNKPVHLRSSFLKQIYTCIDPQKERHTWGNPQLIHIPASSAFPNRASIGPVKKFQRTFVDLKCPMFPLILCSVISRIFLLPNWGGGVHRRAWWLLLVSPPAVVSKFPKYRWRNPEKYVHPAIGLLSNYFPH